MQSVWVDGGGGVKIRLFLQYGKIFMRFVARLSLEIAPVRIELESFFTKLGFIWFKS
jgi:hypothetical protein